YRRFAKRWERLADNLVEEWKAMNVVSALLVAGILTIFQIDGGADTVDKRLATSVALICAMYSLLTGCLLTISLSSVRRPILGIRWAIVSVWIPHLFLT
ncbi:hypothetical protein P691DRAFT_650886, partial [Macrolepiota fuliginosa MF-IS2]